MESDRGKLFIGGISWDTNEDRLRGYFKNFGEVVEAVIMKDRTTGRARGFGFVVFADPAVADRVVMEKHQIDGRMVNYISSLSVSHSHLILFARFMNIRSFTNRKMRSFIQKLQQNPNFGLLFKTENYSDFRFPLSLTPVFN